MATAGIHLTSESIPQTATAAPTRPLRPSRSSIPPGHAIGGLGPESIITSAFALDLSRAADQPEQELSARRAGIASQLHLLEIYRRHQRRAGRTHGGDRRDPANLAPESLGSGGRKRSFDLRRDPCLYRQRDPVVASRPHRLSASARPHPYPGWQFLNITTLTSGSPFTVYSGSATNGRWSRAERDRPDLVSHATFFDQPGGARRLFRTGRGQPLVLQHSHQRSWRDRPQPGPLWHARTQHVSRPRLPQFRCRLIKDTPFGRRGNSELATLEFRAEFFNIFNIVNFGLPSNILRGSGFGLISRTAGSSRQIQFSLKLIY